MFSALLSGLRSLRVSLVTGGMLIGSAYIFLYSTLVETVIIRPSARNVLEFSSLMPAILVVFLCLAVGSLYTTLLEGVVDQLHRKNVHRDIGPVCSRWERIVIASFLPYSESAKKRLVAEVRRFYREHSHQDDPAQVGQAEFVQRVLIEALWMEGKLAGTALESPYDKLRSEGEMRVSGGLLIPLASAAAAYSIGANHLQLVVAFCIGMSIAIPMVNYGLYYFKKANSFLAHHMADGKVLSPSMETLRKESSDRRPKDTADPPSGHKM